MNGMDKLQNAWGPLRNLDGNNAAEMLVYVVIYTILKFEVQSEVQGEGRRAGATALSAKNKGR